MASFVRIMVAESLLFVAPRIELSVKIEFPLWQNLRFEHDVDAGQNVAFISQILLKVSSFVK